MVYDQTGKLITKFQVDDEFYSLNMSNLGTGLYIFKVINDDRMKAFKVISK